MFIARMKNKDKNKVVKATTYVFETEEDLNNALYHLKKCGTPLFAAEVKNSSDNHGRLIGSWNEKKEPAYYPGYTTSYGRYKDTEWVNFGTEEQCKEWECETNDKCMSYFCTSACASHVIGTLWRVNYCTPYND